jgi:hypothetical protein
MNSIDMELMLCLTQVMPGFEYFDKESLNYWSLENWIFVTKTETQIETSFPWIHSKYYSEVEIKI